MSKHGAGRPPSVHSGGQCGDGCSSYGCGGTEEYPHIWDTDKEGTLMLFAGSKICVRCGAIERHLVARAAKYFGRNMVEKVELPK